MLVMPEIEHYTKVSLSFMISGLIMHSSIKINQSLIINQYGLLLQTKTKLDIGYLFSILC